MAPALSWQPAAHFPLPVLGRCLGRSRRTVGYARAFSRGAIRRDYWSPERFRLVSLDRAVEMFRPSSPAIAVNLREIDARLPRRSNSDPSLASFGSAFKKQRLARDGGNRCRLER